MHKYKKIDNKEGFLKDQLNSNSIIIKEKQGNAP